MASETKSIDKVTYAPLSIIVPEGAGGQTVYVVISGYIYAVGMTVSNVLTAPPASSFTVTSAPFTGSGSISF